VTVSLPPGPSGGPPAGPEDQQRAAGRVLSHRPRGEPVRPVRQSDASPGWAVGKTASYRYGGDPPWGITVTVPDGTPAGVQAVRRKDLDPDAGPGRARWQAWLVTTSAPPGSVLAAKYQPPGSVLVARGGAAPLWSEADPRPLPEPAPVPDPVPDADADTPKRRGRPPGRRGPSGKTGPRRPAPAPPPHEPPPEPEPEPPLEPEPPEPEDDTWCGACGYREGSRGHLIACLDG
jgi:hypothetical protein